MSGTFPDSRRTRIPRLRGVLNYLNNFFAMYTRLRTPVYAWNSHFPPTWFRNYLNNYFAMYKRLTRSRVHVELASFVYLGLGIIQIIIFK